MAANMRYEFLEHHGPKRTTLTHSEPFTLRYFVLVGGGVDLSWSDIEGPKGKNVLVHNGWVMNADPLVNFASEGSQVRWREREGEREREREGGRGREIQIRLYCMLSLLYMYMYSIRLF